MTDQAAISKRLRPHGADVVNLMLRRFVGLGIDDAVWPMLMKIELPEACIQPTFTWQQALNAANLPGGQKQILDFAALT